MGGRKLFCSFEEDHNILILIESLLKIIDPARGASTWALGNQRCSESKGNLIRKAKVNMSQIILLLNIIGNT